LLAWCAQPGHATAENDGAAFRDWILGETLTFWEGLETHFRSLSQRDGTGDIYPSKQ